MWDSESDGANGAAVHWRIIEQAVLEPIEDVPMEGATALHVNVLAGNTIIGRAVVPCRSAICSAARLRLHLEPFVQPALARTLRDRFDTDSHSRSPVSIIVCTRNRSDQLERCLASLDRLTAIDCEIVVVDNGDDDGRTESAARRHGARYVPEPVAGLDRARNRGTAEATHDIILFTDDDVEVTPTWAMHLADAFRDPMTAAATGLVLPATLHSREQIEFEMLGGFVRTFDDFVLDGTFVSPASAGRAGAGASMAFRRSFLLDSQGFPDVLDCGRPTSSGGDTFALYNVLRAGHRIRFEPQAVVRHHHRSEEGDGERTVEGYARGVVSYLAYAAATQRDASALAAAAKWSAWRLGLLTREWVTDPRSLSTTYVRRQARGIMSAPYALVRSVRANAAPPIIAPPHRSTGPVDVLRGDASPLTSESPRVSVVIPTAGRRPGLADLVARLHQQTHSVEVIVATDGDYADRAALERAVGASISARVVVGSTGGAGAARNRGAHAATGDVLLFLDDDVLPIDDELVARHAAAHASGMRAAVGPVVGAITNASASGLALSERNWWSDQSARIARGTALEFTDVCSGNLSVDRSLFAELGGFGALTRREDFELGVRIIEAGHDVIGLSDAAVWHVDMCTLDQAIERRSKEGRADCLLADEHPAGMFRLGLGTWDHLGRRRRRLARTAIEHPRATQAALRLAAPTARLLDRLGSRRRLSLVNDLAGMLAYWSGVGAHTGGFAGWRDVHLSLEAASEDASRCTLDLDHPESWSPQRSGTHLIDVTFRGEVVGLADLRWGGLPFDRERFARSCGDHFGYLTGMPERELAGSASSR